MNLTPMAVIMGPLFLLPCLILNRMLSKLCLTTRGALVSSFVYEPFATTVYMDVAFRVHYPRFLIYFGLRLYTGSRSLCKLGTLVALCTSGLHRLDPWTRWVWRLTRSLILGVTSGHSTRCVDYLPRGVTIRT